MVGALDFRLGHCVVPWVRHYSHGKVSYASLYPGI